MIDRKVAVHEASHAASFLVDRLPIKVARADQPTAMTAGEVRLDIDRLDLGNKDVLRCIVTGALCGPVSEGVEKVGRPVEIQGWGQRMAADIVAATTAAIASDFGTIEWHRALWKAKTRIADPAFGRLVAAIAVAFEDTPVLTGMQLERLHFDWFASAALR
jgi:hypothetical protein